VALGTADVAAGVIAVTRGAMTSGPGIVTGGLIVFGPTASLHETPAAIAMRMTLTVRAVLGIAISNRWAFPAASELTPEYWDQRFIWNSDFPHARLSLCLFGQIGTACSPSFVAIFCRAQS
jgi:hypothetical protein